MLVDTDVLIWHLRGFPKATQRLDQLPKLTISAITWLELLQGFRNRAEMLAVQKSLEMRNAERLPITPAITKRATALMETLALSHGLRLGDALIAATAIEHGLTVLTANTKHFTPHRRAAGSVPLSTPLCRPVTAEDDQCALSPTMQNH